VIPEPIAVTLLVTEALEKLGVRYFIGGSFASTVHGEVRTTLDTDLVAELGSDDVAPLVEALGPAFYADAATMRSAIHQHRSFNLIDLATMFKVDVFVSRQRAFDRAQMERRIRQVVATDPERTAYVATAEDIILAKLEWYREGGGVSERQWRDVVGVMRVQGTRLDRDYLHHWGADLGVADLLQRALSEASALTRSE
jgi:hypothetical protein